MSTEMDGGTDGSERTEPDVWRVVGRVVGFWMLAVLGIGVAGYAVATRGFGALAGAEQGPPLANVAVWPGVLTWHAVAGACALVAGIVQGWPLLRGVVTRGHRKLGWVYVGAVAVSGVSGLWIAPWAEGGWMGKTGFGLLAVVWLGATGAGVWAAVRRDFEGHRRWMVRSFALTCAGITLRVQLGVCLAGGYAFEAVYPWIAWACWVPNLILADVCLRKKSPA